LKDLCCIVSLTSNPRENLFVYHNRSFFFTCSSRHQILILTTSMKPPLPPRNLQENMGRLNIFRILGARHQEHLIDPLRASHVTYKELNLGEEGNKHSSQPSKLHPMDISQQIYYLNALSNISQAFHQLPVLYYKICRVSRTQSKVYSQTLEGRCKLFQFHFILASQTRFKTLQRLGYSLGRFLN
jgi:hypothetical protein